MGGGPLGSSIVSLIETKKAILELFESFSGQIVTIHILTLTCIDPSN